MQPLINKRIDPKDCYNFYWEDVATLYTKKMLMEIALKKIQSV